MNYQKIYFSIIEKRKRIPFDCSYAEKHHILPKSIGGLDIADNIVKLSPREHFICHLLLAKMYPKDTFEWFKMNHAFMCMKAQSNKQDRHFNNRIYEYFRNKFSVVMSNQQSGMNNSQYNKMWIHNIEFGLEKKIQKDDIIPLGWIPGRRKKVRTKNCKRCRQEFCSRKEICNKWQMLHTLVKYFGFNETAFGTTKIFEEYDRIVDLLRDEYIVKKLSIEDIKLKYNISSNERLRYIFKSLGINRRSFPEALRNFHKLKKQK